MEKKPSVIISDVTMPKMNGLEMLEKIRATPELKDIPVMLITNLPPEQYAAKGLGLGAVAYLAKGKYTMRELVDKVNTFLNM